MLCKALSIGLPLAVLLADYINCIDFYALVIKHDFIVPGNGFVSLLSIL